MTTNTIKNAPAQRGTATQCQCHRLAALMSAWLYSEGKPPLHLNRVWIKWIDTRQSPTRGEIDQAVRADLEVVSPVITGFITDLELTETQQGSDNE
jgi:hypothetical protein